MRHRKSGVKLGRTSSHRNAMFRNMVTSLFKYDRITTTDAKAKELRSWADHMITLAKRGDLHARRQALRVIREKDVVHELFHEAAEAYGNRNGGYTRVIKIGRRKGDAAPMSIVELVKSESVESKSRPARKEPMDVDIDERPKTEIETAGETEETTPDDSKETELAQKGESDSSSVEEKGEANAADTDPATRDSEVPK